MDWIADQSGTVYLYITKLEIVMASWNGQNKRRKRNDFAKKRKVIELHSRFDDANRRSQSKREKQFDESIARELADDAMDEQIEELENEYLVNKHS